MGAAGYVTIYNEAAVRAAYETLWGDLGYRIEDDWRYPTWPDQERHHGDSVVRVELGGAWYLVDYADDQGTHEGTGNSFWFAAGAEYVDDPEGGTWPNGNTKRVPAPDVIEGQWAEIDERVPNDDQPWEVNPRNRDGMFPATPPQARVLIALRRAGGKSVEVWT